MKLPAVRAMEIRIAWTTFTTKGPGKRFTFPRLRSYGRMMVTLPSTDSSLIRSRISAESQFSE